MVNYTLAQVNYAAPRNDYAEQAGGGSSRAGETIPWNWEPPKDGKDGYYWHRKADGSYLYGAKK